MGAWIGLSLAKQSELVIGRAHELLQASNVISMLMVLGSKSVLITIETQPASTGAVALEPFDSRS